VSRQVEENRYVLPRAFLAPRVRVLADPAARLTYLGRFDPEREAVLHDLPDGVDIAALGPAPLEAEEGASVLETRFDRVEVRATTRRPRLLVVSDTWSRWWSATDNGRPVPILPVDHALRGVILDPGVHHVVFRFRYPIFPAAVAVTLVGWLGVAAVGVAAWRRGSSTGPGTPRGPA
jgi:hypothetical protein